MIPVLYDHSESDFVTNGRGRLSDAISCKVTQELNGIFELVMVYPITGKHYDELVAGRIIYATYDAKKEAEPFDIYRRTAPINGQVTFYARHISYRLNTVIIEPFSANSCQGVMSGLRQHNINAIPFTFSTTVSATGLYEPNRPLSVRAILCGNDSMSVLSLYGGEFEWKKRTVYHRPTIGRITDIELRYGKNITQLTHDLDAGDVHTAVVPYWLSGDGSELMMLPEKIIDNGLGSEKAIVLDVSQKYEAYPENSDVRQDAEDELASADVPKQNITVSFYELWQTEEYKSYTNLQRLYLGDQLKVYYEALGVNTTLRVVKTVYDPLMDRYDTMELGTPKQSYSSILAKQFQDTILQVAPSKSAMQAAIEYATQMITGGLGGHVIFNGDNDGHPAEILIMDTDNKETAVHVMRINVNGIGFSSTGYEGPFTSAWTLDGHFVADFIATGNLNASLLTAGVIQGENGNVKIDLDGDWAKFKLDHFKLVSTSGSTSTEMTVAEAALDGMVQTALFNKLTNNGALQGIFMQNGQIYINMSYLRTGILQVAKIINNQSVETLYVNANNGTVRIRADEFSLAGQSISQIANDSVDVSSKLNQQNVFNALTNNGQIQGIFLQNGKVYLNWEYAQGGALKLGGSANGNGRIEIYDLNNVLIGRIDKDGVELCTSAGFSAESVAIENAILRGKYNGYEKSGIDLVAQSQRPDGSTGDALSLWNNNFAIYLKSDILQLMSYTKYSFSDGTYEQVYIQCAPGSIVSAWQIAVRSDRRLKDNIRDTVVDGEDVINRLRIVEFDWKDGKEPHVPAGLIAQEVEEVYPHAVVDDGKYKAVKYGELVPVLISAVQSQNRRIEKLEQKCADLEARLERLERSMDGTEKHNC